MPPSAREFAEFNGLLASAVEKGLPLAPAVHLMGGVVRDRRLGESLSGVARLLEEGTPLPDALSLHPDVFPPEYCALIRAGSEAGRLAEALRTAQVHQTLAAKVRGRMTKLLLYLLAGAIVGEIVLLIAVVAGARMNAFNDDLMRQLEMKNLPLPQVMLHDAAEMSWILLFLWPALIAVACGGYVLTRKYSRLSILAYAIPIWGRIQKSRDLALFCCASGFRLRSGATVLHSLESARDAVPNRKFRAVLNQVLRRVEEGESLSSALYYVGFFPKTLAWGVSLGEENGEVPRTFDTFASLYTSQMERNFMLLYELLTPIGVLVVGNVALLSAMLMMSPFLSILQIQQNLSN